MALLDDIQELELSLDGSPWCRVTADTADGLDYSLDGSPWWGHLLPSGATTTAAPMLWNSYVETYRVQAIYVGTKIVQAAYAGEKEIGKS